MLTNLPTAGLLEESALRIYFTAWHHVFDIISEMRETETLSFTVQRGRLKPDDGNETEVTTFISGSQHDLQLAYALIQQSQEIGLKARICAVSPFLLLLGADVRTWPAADADFAQFRTLDASDLIKVVNSICPQSVSPQFAALYELVRGNRNKIYHQGSFIDQLDLIVLLGFLVDQYHELYPMRSWLVDRLDFQSRARHNFFYDHHHNERTIVMIELGDVFGILTDSQYKKLFGFSKKTRRYICHACQYDAEFGNTGMAPESVRTATLVDGVDELTCHLCQRNFPIERVECTNKPCKSNVLSLDPDFPGVCHLCGQG